METNDGRGNSAEENRKDRMKNYNDGHENTEKYLLDHKKRWGGEEVGAVTQKSVLGSLREHTSSTSRSSAGLSFTDTASSSKNIETPDSSK